MLGQNAVDCYRLDGSNLKAIANRIGPTPEEVLGDPALDERLLANFHDRSGYLRPPETVRSDFYERMLQEDANR
jgi:hypothetical protein